MKEADIRKWHRRGGIVLALFIAVQTLTGIVLTIENLLGTYWGGIVHELHYELGAGGGLYRILLGTGLMWMAATGVIIYLRIRARTARKT